MLLSKDQIIELIDSIDEKDLYEVQVKLKIIQQSLSEAIKTDNLYTSKDVNEMYSHLKYKLSLNEDIADIFEERENEKINELKELKFFSILNNKN